MLDALDAHCDAIKDLTSSAADTYLKAVSDYIDAIRSNELAKAQGPLKKANSFETTSAMSFCAAGLYCTNPVGWFAVSATAYGAAKLCTRGGETTLLIIDTKLGAIDDAADERTPNNPVMRVATRSLTEKLLRVKLDVRYIREAYALLLGSMIQDSTRSREQLIAIDRIPVAVAALAWSSTSSEFLALLNSGHDEKSTVSLDSKAGVIMKRLSSAFAASPHECVTSELANLKTYRPVGVMTRFEVYASGIRRISIQHRVFAEALGEVAKQIGWQITNAKRSGGAEAVDITDDDMQNDEEVVPNSDVAVHRRRTGQDR